MLQDAASRTLEDNRVELEFNANAGYTIPNRNMPNIFSFRYGYLLASILEMKILEKVGESLGTFQMILFQVSS